MIFLGALKKEPAGVAWLERYLVRQEVAGSIPGRGMYGQQLISLSLSSVNIYKIFEIRLQTLKVSENLIHTHH